jgi:hypothetical protein
VLVFLPRGQGIPPKRLFQQYGGLPRFAPVVCTNASACVSGSRARSPVDSPGLTGTRLTSAFAHYGGADADSRYRKQTTGHLSGSGGRNWWAHLTFTLINMKLTILRKRSRMGATCARFCADASAFHLFRCPEVARRLSSPALTVRPGPRPYTDRRYFYVCLFPVHTYSLVP